MGHGAPTVPKDEIEKALEAKAGKTGKVKDLRNGVRAAKEKKKVRKARSSLEDQKCKAERLGEPVGGSRVLRCRTVTFAL